MLIMSRLFLLILFVVGCHSQGDSCQDIDKPPNPTSGCCGIQLGSDVLETNGEAANNQFPWLAYIVGGESSYFGTLISSRHVLTTSLVNFNNLVMVSLGVIKRNQTGNANHVTIAAASVSVNDMSNESDLTLMPHDIAIITLAQKAPYNEFIRPICLPTSDIVVSPPDNLRFINAGWGARLSKYYELMLVKKFVTLPYINLKNCQKIYRLNQYAPFMVMDNEICAGGNGEIYSTGPLMFKENGHYTLVGVYGSNLFTLGMPVVFTRVYPILTWINSVISKL